MQQPRFFRRAVPLFGLLMLAVVAHGPAAAQTTFKIATLAPSGTQWMQSMRAAAARIGERTDGRVAFRFYPGGVMGNDDAVLRKMRFGQLHGGAISGTGMSRISSDTQIYSLPFAFRSYDEVDHVREAMDDRLIDLLGEQGYRSYGITEGGFAYLMSTEPVRTVADLEGRKVWIPEGDKLSAAAYRALGVSPTPLPLTDVLTALETGLVDTVANIPLGTLALQWHTRLDYLLDVPLMYIVGTLVIQESALERVDAADRAVIAEELEGTFRELDAAARADNREARTALTGQGMETLAPGPEQLRRWREEVGPAVTQVSEEGVIDPALVRSLRERLRAYRSEP